MTIYTTNISTAIGLPVEEMIRVIESDAFDVFINQCEMQKGRLEDGVPEDKFVASIDGEKFHVPFSQLNKDVYFIEKYLAENELDKMMRLKLKHLGNTFFDKTNQNALNLHLQNTELKARLDVMEQEIAKLHPLDCTCMICKDKKPQWKWHGHHIKANNAVLELLIQEEYVHDGRFLNCPDVHYQIIYNRIVETCDKPRSPEFFLFNGSFTNLKPTIEDILELSEERLDALVDDAIEPIERKGSF